VRLALVANVKSGRGLDPAWLVSLLGDAEVFGLDELRRIADVDRIVVSGGDGTIAPVAERAGELGVPLAVIPGGTANDFARANGIPPDPRAAAELATHLGHVLVPVALAGPSSRQVTTAVRVAQAPHWRGI